MTVCEFNVDAMASHTKKKIAVNKKQTIVAVKLTNTIKTYEEGE